MSYVISLGLGSPARIKEFVTFGLSIAAPPAVVTGGEMFLTYGWIWASWRVA